MRVANSNYVTGCFGASLAVPSSSVLKTSLNIPYERMQHRSRPDKSAQQYTKPGNSHLLDGVEM